VRVSVTASLADSEVRTVSVGDKEMVEVQKLVAKQRELLAMEMEVEEDREYELEKAEAAEIAAARARAGLDEEEEEEKPREDILHVSNFRKEGDDWFVVLKGASEDGTLPPLSVFMGSSVRLVATGELTWYNKLTEGQIKSLNKEVDVKCEVVRKEDDLLVLKVDPNEDKNPREVAGGQDQLYALEFVVDESDANKTFSRNMAYLAQLEKDCNDLVAAEGSAILKAIWTDLEADRVTLSPQAEITAEDIKARVGADLNPSQAKAAVTALDKNVPFSIIQGPPGTGKSTVLDAIVRMAVNRGERVLVAAPSNAAVDNMVERLTRDPKGEGRAINCVRVGNPEKMTPTVLNYAISELVDEIPGRETGFTAQQITKVVMELRAILDASDENMSEKETEEIATEMKRLMAIRTSTRKEGYKSVLGDCDVVLCTLTGVGEAEVGENAPYDLVVVDEASQAIEANTWGALLKGKRAVLAGDTKQLAPTILSMGAKKGGLDVSLMERASSLRDGAYNNYLDTQYRMNKAISDWSSQQVYDGIVQPHESVADRTLNTGIAGVMETDVTSTPLMLLDTCGLGFEEEPGSGTSKDSLMNEGECAVVEEHVQSLLKAGVEPDSIAVISPYSAQVKELSARLGAVGGGAGIECATVDSWQGREADAVIISMVRSNSNNRVGFLADERRMNVAVTRARMHCAVVCNSQTVESNTFLSTLLEACKKDGIVATPDVADTQGEWAITDVDESVLAA